MALSKVTKNIRDGANVAFAMVMAKVATPPSAAVSTDTILSAHSLIDTTETLVNPSTSDLQTTLNTEVGIVTETAPTTDTASSGLNGRMQRLAQRLTTFFGTMTMAHTAPSVTTSSGTALASNASRRYALFQNMSLTINIGLNLANGTASATTGIVLMPGQSYEMSGANGNLTTSAVTCCAASGTPSLLVTEGS